MMIRKSLLALSLVGAFVAPLAAHADETTTTTTTTYSVTVKPPAPVVEVLPPRQGYVVTPGYYRYNDGSHSYVWNKGGYEPVHPGQHYVPSEWKEKDGRYGFFPGHWESN